MIELGERRGVEEVKDEGATTLCRAASDAGFSLSYDWFNRAPMESVQRDFQNPFLVDATAS